MQNDLHQKSEENHSNKRAARPFLRWAGSKQRLLSQILPIVPRFSGVYFEPFLGSGALFWALAPEKAKLSDASSELIGTWHAVRDNSEFLCEYLQPLKPSKELYYDIRNGRADTYPLRAAEFLYLNKTCWNGLYRVNAKGEFNVPYGAPQSDFIFDKDNLLHCSELLRRPGVEIMNVDFEVALGSARSGDLVFLDPPYVTKHNFNGFRDYNEKLFGWSDQERLAGIASRLAASGVHVIVSNADHTDVAALYQGFRMTTLSRPSTLASDPTRRGRVTEALFHSF